MLKGPVRERNGCNAPRVRASSGCRPGGRRTASSTGPLTGPVVHSDDDGNSGGVLEERISGDGPPGAATAPRRRSSSGACRRVQRCRDQSAAGRGHLGAAAAGRGFAGPPPAGEPLGWGGGGGGAGPPPAPRT